MSSKPKSFLIVLIVSMFSFIWGAGIGIYKWFPYFYLLEVKQFLTFNKTKNVSEILSLDNSYIQNHVKSINTKTVLTKRKELLERLIPKENTISVTKEKLSANSERIVASVYKNEINAILTHTTKSKKCLTIYIQGHGGDPFNYSYHNKLLKFFSNNGCDFLSMSMIGLGLNEGNFSYPSRYGKINLDKDMAKIHKNYAFFFDNNDPNLDPLTLFIAPHYNIIKSLKSDYNKISIMGISGGGWYSVWLSALIPEIKFTVSYAGSLPMEYRKFDGVSGDWEQQDSQIYNYISYWELYKLMTVDKIGKENRQGILVYNSEDDCCFYNPYAQDFKSKIDKMNWKNFDVIIDQSDKHSINIELLKKIYKSKY